MKNSNISDKITASVTVIMIILVAVMAIEVFWGSALINSTSKNRNVVTPEPTKTPCVTDEYVPLEPTAEPEDTPGPTETPFQTPENTLEPTPTPTLEPTAEPTVFNAVLKTPIASQNIFETDKVYVTSYAYTEQYKDHGAFKKNLIGFFEEGELDDEYFVHSIATNNALLPAGSIIYIRELNMHFRVDDNASTYVMQRRTENAWERGASIWIDIYVHKDAEEGKSGELTHMSDRLKDYIDLIANDVLHFSVIRFGY